MVNGGLTHPHARSGAILSKRVGSTGLSFVCS